MIVVNTVHSYLLFSVHFSLSSYKGSTERFIGTFETGLAHKLPGTTRSNIKDRGEYNSHKEASIPMGVFLELLHIWVIDIYNQSLNKGAGGIPSKLWDHHVQINPPAWPNSLHELPVLLGKVAFRRITAKGIELQGLYYNSIKLNKTLNSFSVDNDGYNQTFKVKWDPLEMSKIYVYDHVVIND